MLISKTRAGDNSPKTQVSEQQIAAMADMFSEMAWADGKVLKIENITAEAFLESQAPENFERVQSLYHSTLRADRSKNTGPSAKNIITELNLPQQLDVLRALFAVAKSDGVIHPQEQRMILDYLSHIGGMKVLENDALQQELGTAGVTSLPYPIPENEVERLAALKRLQILHSQRAPEFDAIVGLAASMLRCPIALISIVDGKEQWFKAKHGLEIDGTTRDVSFCAHTILSDEVLVVEDATKDERFNENPLVTDSPNIRFYAGCPLSIDGKHTLGALCVVDSKPRTLSETERMRLIDLGKIVEGMLRAFEANENALKAKKLVDAKQAELNRQISLLEQISHISGAGGWSLDLETEQLIWTAQTKRIHDVAQDYIPVLDEAINFYASKSRAIVDAAVQNCIATGEGWRFEAELITAKGKRIWVQAVGEAMYREQKVVGVIGAIRDITEQVETTNKIKHLSLHDDLTGIANRSKFNAELDLKMEAAKAGDRQLAVAIVDVDRFKEINDSFGHLMGDKLLIEIAQRLKNHMRETDVVARLGGDEFAVVLDFDGQTYTKSLDKFATNIIEAMTQPFTADGQSIDVSISMGITLADTKTSSAKSLLSEADLALYHVKYGGRGNYKIYSEKIGAEVAELRKHSLSCTL